MSEEGLAPTKRKKLTPEERARREAERLERSRQAKQKALQSYNRRKEAVSKLEGKARLRERKLDTRLKIILGAYVLRHMEQDNGFKAQVAALVHRVAEPAEAQLFVDQLAAITARRTAAEAERKVSARPPRS